MGLPCVSRRRTARCPSLRSTPTTGPVGVHIIPAPHRRGRPRTAAQGSPRPPSGTGRRGRAAGDRVRHRIAAGDPLSPLIPTMSEHRHTRKHIPATWRVRQVFQRFRQPDTDLPGRGDRDRQVPERFIGGAVGGDPVPRPLPLSAATARRSGRHVEVVTRGGKPFAALRPHAPVPRRDRFSAGRARRADAGTAAASGSVPIGWHNLSPHSPTARPCAGTPSVCRQWGRPVASRSWRSPTATRRRGGTGHHGRADTDHHCRR